LCVCLRRRWAECSPENTPDWHLIMAASAISLVPVVVLFFIGQRHLVKGIALTGVKG
jgi:multiple sugar transport system permease protein